MYPNISVPPQSALDELVARHILHGMRTPDAHQAIVETHLGAAVSGYYQNLKLLTGLSPIKAQSETSQIS